MNDTNLKIMDEAIRVRLFEKFKDIMEIDNLNQDTAVYPKEVAQRIIGDKRTEATLEFINVWRTSTRRAGRRENAPLARHGLYVQYDDPVTKEGIEYVKSMPADMEYSAWFWSKDKDKLNAVIERYLFWRYQDPNLNLTYQGDIDVEYDILFADAIDESPIPEMFDIGLYFVVRFDFLIQGWVFQPALAVTPPYTDLPEIKTVHKVFLKIYDDVDPGGPAERSILLFENEYDLTAGA